MAWTENLLGLCLFGRAPDAAFLGFAWWLKFRSGVSKSNVSAFFWLRFRVARALFLCFFFATFRHFSGCGFASLGHYFLCFFFVFSGFQKRRFGIFPAAVSQWLGHKTCWGSGGLFRMRVPNTFFLSLAWWLAGFFFVFSRFQKQRFGSFLAAVSHGLGTISFFLMGSKSDVSAFFRLRFRNGLGTKPAGALPFRMRSRRSFLRLCLVAEVSQWLGHDFIVFRGSKSNVSRFLRLQFRNGLDAKPAGALPFRMRSGRSFLRLCLVAEVSQWLGHDFIVFRGSKSNVSRFLRLQFRNGLDAKPAGALPFRMRSGRSFLRLCLVADVSQWLGHDSIVFRGSKSNVSRFLRLQFRNGLDAKPAGALPFRMRSGRSFLRLCLVAEVSQWLGHDFIVFRGSKSNVSRFLRLQFRNGLDAKPAGALPFRMRSGRSFLRLCLVAEVSQWLGHDSIVFRGSKSNVSRFLRLQFRNGLDAKPAGALPCRMRSGRSFLRLCLVAEVSQWLGHDSIVFRDSKRNVSRFLRLQFRSGLDAKPAGALPFRMRSRRSFLRLCLVAEVSQWLGHDSIVFRGSNSNVSRFLRLQFRNGLDAKPAGALPFQMRSGRSFLRLCLVADVSQLLGHDSIVFRGSKSNVSRFLRLQFRNGLDAKPAGALPFRMRSGRSFLRLCLVAEVSQWLGHDFIVFRGSKSNVSRFLRLQFRNGLDAKPAGALPFRMRSGRSFLRLCLVAEVSQWLGHDSIVFRGSKSNVSRFLRLQFRNGLDAKPAGLCLFGCAPDAAFLGFAWWLKFRSGWGTIPLFLGVPKATFRDF